MHAAASTRTLGRPSVPVGRRARSHGVRLRCSAIAGPETRDPLKQQLLATVTRLNSEVVEDDSQELAAMRGLVEQLAAVNPTPGPAASPLINGTWVLLFTLPSAPQGPVERSALQQVLAALYNFFFKYVPVIAGSAVGRKASTRGGVTARGNFQSFDTRRAFVGNQARFEVFGRPGCIDVDGSAQVVQGRPGMERIVATFTSAELRVGDGFRLPFPIGLFSPTGFIDTLYLDQQLRISQGDKGSIFIARRADAPGPEAQQQLQQQQGQPEQERAATGERQRGPT